MFTIEHLFDASLVTLVDEGDPALREYAVAHSVAAKARIVAADEREGGIRAILNLGHTFGHARATPLTTLSFTHSQ